MRSPVETAAAEAERSGRAGARAPLRFLVCGARGSGKSTLTAKLIDGRAAAGAPGSEADYR